MALGHLRKGGGQPMRVTLTIHIGNYVITIVLKKSENRHSAK